MTLFPAASGKCCALTHWHLHCLVQAALERAESAGQLYVTAAGNDYGVDIDNVPVYPASYQNRNIISVIATDQNHRLAAYSNYGQRSTDIAAPGSNILSTVLAGQYGYIPCSQTWMSGLRFDAC